MAAVIIFFITVFTIWTKLFHEILASFNLQATGGCDFSFHDYICSLFPIHIATTSSSDPCHFTACSLVLNTGMNRCGPSIGADKGFPLAVIVIESHDCARITAHSASGRGSPGDWVVCVLVMVACHIFWRKVCYPLRVIVVRIFSPDLDNKPACF